MSSGSQADRIASVATLDDPVRRTVFECVSRSRSAVSRDAVAAVLGLSRRVAALHLDRLASQGLLVVEFRRLHGRSGPGAGRTSKLYRRAAGDLAVSVPARRYEFIGRLFVAAVGESLQTGVAVETVLSRLADEFGAALGRDGGELHAALEEAGYEPTNDADHGALTLLNCPFDRLATDYPDLVCGVNRRLLQAAIDHSSGPSFRTVMDPIPGRCCVRLVPLASGDDPVDIFAAGDSIDVRVCDHANDASEERSNRPRRPTIDDG